MGHSQSLLASFVDPATLSAALAAAVAVPLIVHLLFRQRERIVEWAAMRFLPTAKRKRQRRIDHWPLFLARTAAALLPLLAMLAVLPGAERLWQSIKPGVLESSVRSPRTHTVLVLDATLSMTANRDGESPFELAKNQIDDCIARANPGDGFSLLILGKSAEAAVPGPSNQFEIVREELRRAEPFHGPADFATGLNAAMEMLARSPAAYARRQVMIFTDRQRSAWTGLLPTAEKPAPDVWQKLSARADLAIIDVGFEGVDNLAVTDLVLADPLPLVDDPALVTATVRNCSRQDRQQVRVELLVSRPPGGTLAALEQRVIESIPAGGQASVSFLLDGAARLRAAGEHVVQVKLAESDAVAADDARSLAFPVRESINVLLVNGRPSGSPLLRASGFLAEALAPGPGNPFRARTVSIDEFTDATLSDLANVDCVVLCDVPAVTPSQIARMESLLKRGGGVVITLGPNAVRNRELYNRLLGPEGCGFLPGRLVGEAVTTTAFHFTAPEAAYRLPPLGAFQDANARAGLVGVPFQKYAKLELPAESPARRVLSFAELPAASTDRPDAALVEMPKHRGRVVVFASTLNREWTDWPVLPSFLPFVHELLRFAVANRDPWTLTVGDAVEDFFPANAVGQTATLTRPDGRRETASIGPAENGGTARFGEATQAGLWQLSVPGVAQRTLAVNVANTAAGLGESDLRRAEVTEFSALLVQIVKSFRDVQSSTTDGVGPALTPRPHGPEVAKSLAIFGLLILAFELFLAWRLGPARSALTSDATTTRLTVFDRILRLLGWVAVLFVALISIVVVPAVQHGQLPEFVPENLRAAFERWFAVPAAGPGEGTRWRFATNTILAGSFRTDRMIVIGAMAALAMGALLLYRRERRAVGRWGPLRLPLLLRIAAYTLLGFVVLPQLRIVFEREGNPEIIILLDTSASMGTVDPGLSDRHRLGRVQDFLLKGEGDFLKRLQSERRVVVQIMALSDRTSLAATLDEPGDLPAVREVIRKLQPTGPSSRLGDGVESIVKANRGGALAAIVITSDGVTTQGADLAAAGRVAARAGVPVFSLGVGDRRDPLDLALADLRLDDVVAKGDELVVEARLTARGAVTGPVTVTLYEKRGDEKLPLDKTSVPVDASGKPSPVKLKFRPAETGEKTLVLEAPEQPGELDTANNRAERTVLVTAGRKLRVLFIEGRPRYEFRYLKTLFEREVESTKERSLDFQFWLADAGKDFPTTDRSALRAFPSRAELFEYDVVILGDVDPQALPRAQSNLQDLAEFVRVRGGGLLLIAGEQALPWKYFDSPLAELMPILPDGNAPATTSEDRPLTDGYRFQLTALGRQHPILRLASDESENAALWQRLPGLLWCSGGYTKRQAAEVLATHPILKAGDEPLPLILQQFSGAGRTIFFAFDETWRWRLRRDEELFNRFWRQALRVIAKNRVSRAELRTGKPGPFRRDEPIEIIVRFPDDAPPPAGPVKVSIERVSPNGDRETSALVLTKQTGQRAAFTGSLTHTPDGAYRLRLVEPVEAKAPTLEVTVLPPPGEADRLELNALDLMRAAGESGGKYYPLENAGTLLDDLPEGLRTPLNQPCPPVELWNLPLTFVALLSLLGLEWVVRKRARLL